MLLTLCIFQKENPEIRNGNLKYGDSERDNSITSDANMGMATPGGMPSRSRPSSKMTKYVECWGADKPFANIAESTLAKNIELTSESYQQVCGFISLSLTTNKFD
ncbi:hypothetical protein HHI36_019982 [Cryptolaemus montrouzieri]|uniref:Uncharacterized protein n=1 Tax=Cryptolaemus montrouzieri TaxID=559131 RepID=A0ABD2N998_9CUCU